MITAEQKQKYLENPYDCPVCESEVNLESGGDGGDFTQYWRPVKCTNPSCNLRFREIFTITDIEEI